MVEPLEETRSELTFVTEYFTSSLSALISPSSSSGSRRNDGASRPPGTDSAGEIDLDEVEIQKGTLQIARALTFLHQQAKMVHLNISPEAILVNAKVSTTSLHPFSVRSDS
jgi:SCY1-like protein 2